MPAILVFADSSPGPDLREGPHRRGRAPVDRGTDDREIVDACEATGTFATLRSAYPWPRLADAQKRGAKGRGWCAMSTAGRQASARRTGRRRWVKLPAEDP